MKTLYSIQETHVTRLEKILKTHKHAFDGSDTGTGKTVCAVNVIKRLEPPFTLVLCPKAVIPSWRREIDSYYLKNVAVTNYEALRTGKLPYGSWQKVNRTEFWNWNLPEDSLIVFDEARRCAGEASQNSEILIAVKQAKVFKSLQLSATLANSPIQLKAAGYVLGLHCLRDYVGWAKRYGCSLNFFRKLEFTGTPGHIEALGQALSPFTSRMTREMLADHFTETQINTEPLYFTEKLQDCYREMEAELAFLAERASKDRGADSLVVQLRARQKIELLKVPVMVELAEEALVEGKSVAFFVNFTQTLEALQERFSDSVVIHGQQSAFERQFAIDAFSNDEKHVVICNTKAGGIGISLHDTIGNRPRLALISPDWNEEAIIQALGRVHRAGGKTPSQQRILFAADSVEEAVEKSLRKKIQNLNLLNATAMIEYAEPNAENTNDLTLASDPVPVAQPEAPAAASDPVTEVRAEPTATVACEVLPKTVSAAEVDHSSRAHAEHSPSSLKYFEACPSYQKRDGETTAIAEVGTKIHEALDTEDLSKLFPEEIVIAEFCLKFRDYIRAGRPAPLVKQYKEIRLNIDLGVEKTFGSCDVFDVYGDDTGVLMDWKTGYNGVDDAEINSQVWAYTLGCFQKFPNIKKIDAYLVLPRRQEISHHTFVRDTDLVRMQGRLSLIIERAKALKGKTFTPQEGVCDYCAGRATCQALADKALKLGKLSHFEVPDSVNLAENTPENKAKLYKLAVLLTGWAEDVKKELLRQALEEGSEMPGYTLSQRRTPRTIEAPIVAYNTVKDILSLEEFLSAASRISVTSLEDLYAEKAPRGKKTAWKAELLDKLQDAGVLKQDGVVNYLKADK